MKITITQDSNDGLKLIALTQEQAAALRNFIAMTKDYREGELEASEQLSHELKEDGTPRYPDAKGSASLWKHWNRILDEVKEAIDKAQGI